MIARFGHRPMLKALLALSATGLVVVVITLAMLLITATPSTAPPPSGSVGDNPAAPAPKVMDAGSYSEVYGLDNQAGGEHYGDQWNNYGHDFDQPQPAKAGNGADSVIDRHQAAPPRE